MKIRSLDSLIYNPIWIGKLLHYFLSGAMVTNGKKIKFELTYLALPFIYDEKILLKLKDCNVRSSFRSVFSDKELKYRLIGMDEKITAFTEITNQAIITIGNKISFTKDGYIFTFESIDYKNSKDALKEHYKAAYNLGNILAKDDHREIFLKLGALV
jgi:Family of unknown function (DUF6521)